MDYLSFRFKNQLITAFFCSLLAITTSVLSFQKSDLQPPVFETPAFCPVAQPCKIIIVIPAYNEEKRITKTLLTYFDYFTTCPNISATFLVVCNNCSDKTADICKELQKDHPELHYMDLKPGGKGFAIKQGFLKALDYQDADYIGFVDADMATTPPYFYELIINMQGHDGVVASRYKNGARVWPNRPFVKKIGGKFYNWVLRKNFHLDILDTQCGAKLFTYDTIKKAAPQMKEIGWAWDLEFLYLCQLFDKDIIEIPTTWIDAPGSHLTISGCYKEFITSPVRIKNNHKQLAARLAYKKAKTKHKNRRHNSQPDGVN
ncbi:MAG: glycosyltransferase [Candidatus Chromulinivorax sp.]|nr:glycosyltransferase [Candidatus Chromulinivorax sp.]